MGYVNRDSKSNTTRVQQTLDDLASADEILKVKEAEAAKKVKEAEALEQDIKIAENKKLGLFIKFKENSKKLFKSKEKSDVWTISLTVKFSKNLFKPCKISYKLFSTKVFEVIILIISLQKLLI